MRVRNPILAIPVSLTVLIASERVSSGISWSPFFRAGRDFQELLKLSQPTCVDTVCQHPLAFVLLRGFICFPEDDFGEPHLTQLVAHYDLDNGAQ